MNLSVLTAKSEVTPNVLVTAIVVVVRPPAMVTLLSARVMRSASFVVPILVSVIRTSSTSTYADDPPSIFTNAAA